MKFPLTFTAALGAAFIFSAAAQSLAPAPAPAAEVAQKGTGPILKFATMEHNFEKIPSDSMVAYTFVFTNMGDETLKISSVSPGCHCTTVRHWSDNVEPGKTGEIPLQFDSHGQNGDIQRWINVTSNDRSNSVQQLTLKGKIWKVIQVSPDIGFIQVHSNSPNTLLVNITNTLEQPITLSGVKSDSTSFSAELKTNIPGKTFQVLITALPPFKANQNNAGIVTVQTSYTNIPQLRIQAFAIVQRTPAH